VGRRRAPDRVATGRLRDPPYLGRSDAVLALRAPGGGRPECRHRRGRDGDRSRSAAPRRGTRGCVRDVCLLGLAPLCGIEIAVIDDIRLSRYEVYDGRLVEQLWAARLVDDATRIIAWSSFALAPVLAVLHTLQRRSKSAPIPRACVIS